MVADKRGFARPAAALRQGIVFAESFHDLDKEVHITSAPFTGFGSNIRSVIMPLWAAALLG